MGRPRDEDWELYMQNVASIHNQLICFEFPGLQESINLLSWTCFCGPGIGAAQFPLPRS